MISIHILPILKDNYSFIITDTNGLCAIIDPGEAAPLIAFLKQNRLKPSFILNTHHHGDHVAGNVLLKSRYGCRVLGPAQESALIPGLDVGIDAGSHISFGGSYFEPLPTRGHTRGGLMYYLPEASAVFVGDTLFGLGCGRVFEGTAEDLFHSLQRLKTLPAATKIYCGHEYTLTNARFARSLRPNCARLGARIARLEEHYAQARCTLPLILEEECETNPFLLCDDPESFAALRRARNDFRA